VPAGLHVFLAHNAGSTHPYKMAAPGNAGNLHAGTRRCTVLLGKFANYWRILLL